MGYRSHFLLPLLIPHWSITSAILSSESKLHCVLRESQSHEDIILLPLLFSSANGKPGTFVEIGAYDGHDRAQTWLLEKCFNWTGVLIEASPQNFAELTRCNRSSVKVHSAVCNGTGEVTVAGGGGTVAGVIEDFAPSFARQWSKVRKQCGGSSCSSRVPCRPLGAIIADAGFPQANFLSLDVEGGEEKVVQTLSKDLHSFPFDVVMVEADRHDHARNARVRRLLLDIGLKQRPLPQMPGSQNELFIRPEVHDVRTKLNHSRALLAALQTSAGKAQARQNLLPLEKSPWTAQLFKSNSALLLQRLVTGLGESELEDLLL